jgi:hypothetical protein
VCAGATTAHVSGVRAFNFDSGDSVCEASASSRNHRKGPTTASRDNVRWSRAFVLSQRGHPEGQYAVNESFCPCVA